MLLKKLFLCRMFTLSMMDWNALKQLRNHLQKVTLRNSASVSSDVPGEMEYKGLQNLIRSHYKILESCEPFIGNYSSNTFCKYFHMEQILIVQKKKKSHCSYTSSTLNYIPRWYLNKRFSYEKDNESEDNESF